MNLRYLASYQQCLDDINIRFELGDSLAYNYGYLNINDDDTFEVYHIGACVAKLHKPREKWVFRLNTKPDEQLITLESIKSYGDNGISDEELADTRKDLKKVDAELKKCFAKMDKALFLELFALEIAGLF